MFTHLEIGLDYCVQFIIKKYNFLFFPHKISFISFLNCLIKEINENQNNVLNDSLHNGKIELKQNQI